MASKALHAAWRRSTSCGVGWICSETNDPAMAITLAIVLCTTLPTHAHTVHKNNPGRVRMGKPKPTRASMVMVAPSEIPRNAQQGKVKAAPNAMV
jgi:hypothetical protein